MRGHDGFQFLTTQYYFLNHKVTSGEYPLWMPFLTHGTVSTVWSGLQNTFSINVLSLAGSLLKNVNFLTLFHVAMLWEEMLYLIGMWLLSGKHLESSWARGFVLVAASGSLLWVDQPWFNFHIYACLPLILHLVHRFLDTQRSWPLLLAINLALVQALGNLPYCLPVQTLAVVLYFCCHFIANRTDLRKLPRVLRRGTVWPGVLATFALSALLVHSALTAGTESIANYYVDREADGTVRLDVFLNYGSQVNFRKWLEMTVGVSPLLDYTLYCGVICLPLMLFGIVVDWRRSFALAATAALLILFSAGIFPASLFWHVWPFMKYFRHVGMLGPLVKVFLILLAGRGFEAAFVSGRRTRLELLMAAVFLIALSVCLGALSQNYVLSRSMVDYFAEQRTTASLCTQVLLADPLRIRLVWTALLACLCGGAFLAIGFSSRCRRFRWTPALVLALLAADVYGYKFDLLSQKTIRLSPAGLAAFRFAPIPYADVRLRPPDSDPPHGDVELTAAAQRTWFDQNVIRGHPRLAAVPDPTGAYGSNYWSLNAFLYVDELGCSSRVDNWLLPLDHYLRAYWRDGPKEYGQPVRGHLTYSMLVFPFHPAAARISGSEGKLHFFSAAAIGARRQVAGWITDSTYRGDLVYLTAPDGTAPQDVAGPLHPVGDNPALEAMTRLQLEHEVTRFNANRVNIRVVNPTGRHVWLLYSDVWHPWWSAQVNGRPRHIHVGNLAYKAILLEPGLNQVEFRCSNQGMTALVGLLSALSTFWVGYAALLVFQALFGEQCAVAD